VVQDPRVEQFRKEHTETLLSFLRVAYADDPRKSDAAFWKWHYLENPNTNINDIPLWVVTSGNEIVGQMATIPVQLKTGTSERLAIWILDFIVREDFRGKGFGKKLVLAAREKYSTMITLGINEQSAGLFRTLGWANMGNIHRHQKILYAGNGIRGAAEIAPIRGMLNLLSWPLRKGIAQSARASKFSMKRVDRFGDEFERLWERAAVQWPCVARRDPRVLAWQFDRQPEKKFEIVGAYKEDQLVGYAVLFFRNPTAGVGSAKAAISDFCFQQENAEKIADALIGYALQVAVERRAGSLVTDVLNGLVEEKLQRHGFWRIKKSPQFMAWASENQELICNPANWFLTRGDSDVSIIEQPNL
jgi:GNAT superfamily N-acetyltransferase